MLTRLKEIKSQKSGKIDHGSKLDQKLRKKKKAWRKKKRIKTKYQTMPSN